MTTLLLSSRHTDDNQSLWRAAIRRNWDVVRLQGIRVPEVADRDLVIYVEALFARHVARTMGRQLLDCTEDWLVRLPSHLKQRQISLQTIADARLLTSRNFIKPPTDKSFPAKVYESGRELPDYLDDADQVLIADPVHWDREFRCFCLDGKVRTCSPYLRRGEPAQLTGFHATSSELAEATAFAESVLATSGVATPRGIVLDVGILIDQGWAVVETNGAWGSGIYGCDPDSVLDVVRHATSPISR